MINPTEMVAQELEAFEAVAPSDADNFICGRGRVTFADLLALITAQQVQNKIGELLNAALANFNAGEAFAGKVAIGTASKKLFIYADGWRQVKPVVVDGAAMLTLSEEVFDEVI